jgi:hypothetical protein
MSGEKMTQEMKLSEEMKLFEEKITKEILEGLSEDSDE